CALVLGAVRSVGGGDGALLELSRSTGRLPVPPVSEGAPPKRTYNASSKRNPFYPGVVIRARETGYEVHDWSDPPLAIDPDCQNWTCSQYIAALRHSPPASISRTISGPLRRATPAFCCCPRAPTPTPRR